MYVPILYERWCALVLLPARHGCYVKSRRERDEVAGQRAKAVCWKVKMLVFMWV